MRQHKWFWLFCVLLMAFQSFLPTSAVAFVSVRCVGAPSTAPDCAQAIVPVADTNRAGTYLAPLSCCRHMHGGCPMTNDLSTRRTPRSVTLSVFPCLVTVNPLNTERSAATISIRQWMLAASPALAPPALGCVLPQIDSAAVSHSLFVSRLAFSPPPASHGLRAPPVA